MIKRCPTTMISRLFLVLIMCLFANIASKAQTYKGQVTDANGNPLASVSVVLMNESGKNVMFSRTDAQGKFSIAMPEGKVASQLAFICVGYARNNVQLAKFKNNQVIKMTESVQKIKEVKVTPQKIRIQGDTLFYSVSGLRTKQDRSIEDVIARIPGITVSTNGQISYNGKPINKFYVDHKDMVGDSYNMISRNLSADKVDSVEVMENHQPINSLRGKVFSENAALNLVLKEGAKLQWVGSAGVGNGMTLQSPLKWNRKLRLVEMYFGQKYQTMVLYKHNNIGEDILSEVTGLGFDMTDGGMITNISGLGTGRTGFNNSHVCAVNILKSVDEKQSLRLQVFGLYDKSVNHDYSEMTYLDTDGKTEMVQQRNSRSYQGDMRFSLNYSFNGKKAYLNNTLMGRMTFDHSDSRTNLNQREIFEEVLPRKRSVTDWLTFNISPTEKYTLEGTSSSNYTYLPGRILLYNGNQETLNIHALQIETEIKYMRNLLGALKLNVNLKHQLESKREYVAYNDTTDNASFLKHKIDLYTGLNYFDKKWNVNVGNTLSYLSQSIGIDEDKRWVCMPTVSVHSQIDRLWTLDFRYNHRFSPTGFYQVNPIRVYTSYNYAATGTGKLDNTTGDNIHAGVSYAEPGEGWRVAGDYSLNRNSYSHLYESRLMDGIYVRDGREMKGEDVSQTVGGNIGCFFHALRTNVNCNCHYTWSDNDMLRNLVRTSVGMRTLDMGLMIKMRISKAFNYEAGSSMIVSQQKLKDADSKKYKSFNHSLNLFFTPGSWLLTMRNECRHSPDGSEKFNVYSEASLSYKKKRYELKVDCKNLWGDNKREYKSFSALGSSYSVIEYRPREVMASVIFSI